MQVNFVETFYSYKAKKGCENILLNMTAVLLILIDPYYLIYKIDFRKLEPTANSKTRSKFVLSSDDFVANLPLKPVYHIKRI